MKMLDNRTNQYSHCLLDEIKDREDHSKWRLAIAWKIAERLNFIDFGVKGIYLVGSVKNLNCGPGSDIDLLVHVEENIEKQKLLKKWFEGWSLCIAEINYAKTGLFSEGLIDIHLITDEDIKNKNSFAVMIGAITDGAMKLK